MDSSQAVPAIVFLLILLTIAAWMLSLCRDGHYDCKTSKKFKNSQMSFEIDFKFSLKGKRKPAGFSQIEPSINHTSYHYTSTPVHNYEPPIWQETFYQSNGSISRETTPDDFNVSSISRANSPNSSRSTPRSKPAPYVKSNKCTRSGMLYWFILGIQKLLI